MKHVVVILTALLVLSSVAFAQVKKPAANNAGDVRKNSIGMELVWIPPGEFMMGSDRDNEKPVHRVTISQGFWTGKYEVTQSQWRQVMGTDPSHFKGDELPVEEVSWLDANEFISKLNAKNDGYIYSLPTEAQWEYAARAGTTGDNYGDLDSIAWYEQNSGSRTHPVGQKKPNAFGLYEMLGNVVEWCADWYGVYDAGAATDPTGPPDGKWRVVRGGSWLNPASVTRSANRNFFSPSFHGLVGILGFRVAARVK